MESRQTENKNSQHFKLKVGRLGAHHWCQAQQNGLVPGVGVLLFEADSEKYVICQMNRVNSRNDYVMMTAP